MFAGLAVPDPEGFDPTLQPTTEPDPFNPDVANWPPPPPWLFPAVMVLLAIVVLVALVLLGMWIKSVRVARAERAAKPPTQWVDLSKLDKKGRWEDQDHNPRAGGIDRER
jgi:hypothetical protein